MRNKVSLTSKFLAPAFAAMAITAVSATPTLAAACLTTPASAVGNAAFGATVQTFIDLAINPNTTCIENGDWSDPSGFGLGTYVTGGGATGKATDPTVLGAYDVSGSAAANANARDFQWIQDASANANLNGIAGSAPTTGIIWDLGGQANQVAVFVFVDHGPVPGEVLENTAWLSNTADTLNVSAWTQASLVHVYGGGWSPDPNIADGFVAVYQLPNAATFRYVSVTWGGPGAVVRDGDNEIDAVGGLNFQGGGLGDTDVPEPATLSLLAAALIGLGGLRRRKTPKA